MSVMATKIITRPSTYSSIQTAVEYRLIYLCLLFSFSPFTVSFSHLFSFILEEMTSTGLNESMKVKMVDDGASMRAVIEIADQIQQFNGEEQPAIPTGFAMDGISCTQVASLD